MLTGAPPKRSEVSMFQEGFYYRHRNCLDMDIYIVKVLPNDYYTIGYVARDHVSLFWPEPDTVKIKNKQGWEVV